MNAAVFLVGAVLTFGMLTVTGCATPYGEAEAQVSSDVADTSAAAKTEAPKKSTHATSPSAPVEAVAAPAASVPAAVALSWNRASATAAYSLDVLLIDGNVIGPCEDVDLVGQSLDFDFRGVCVSPNIQVRIADVKDFRICSAENDDWQHALCAYAHWDGTSATVHIDN